MSCPNGDPDFNKVLERIVGDSSPSTRKSIYYFVCIWVRLVLYGAVWVLRDKWWIRPAVGLPSALAVWNLSGNLEGNQWWSKKFQFVMAVLITLACLVKTDTRLVPALLFTSLAGGLFQSFGTTWC